MTARRVPTRGRTPAVGARHTVPEPDPIARDYLLLALRLGQRIEGLVDGYFGPRDLKAAVETSAVPTPERLADDAAALRGRVATEAGDPGRERWLDRQLLALETLAGGLSGRTVPYVEEVSRCFDAPPRSVRPAVYREARRTLDALVPGEGDLPTRLRAWDDRFVIPADRLERIVGWLLPRIREVAVQRFGAPEGESLQVKLVTGQPWSAYNWYDGGLRSRVDLNTDLPIRPASLIATLCHETFPGHHLEHASKEERLVQEQGRLEASILLIDTPECYISEGLAEVGRRYTLDDALWIELLVGSYGSAGIDADASDAERQLRISEQMQRLRGAGGDAALMLHRDGRPREEVEAFLRDEGLSAPDTAAKRVDFISHPLWRTYVFSYSGGEALVRAWCEAGPEEPGRRFARLLTEQLTPSALAEEVADGRS